MIRILARRILHNEWHHVDAARRSITTEVGEIRISRLRPPLPYTAIIILHLRLWRSRIKIRVQTCTGLLTIRLPTNVTTRRVVLQNIRMSHMMINSTAVVSLLRMMIIHHHARRQRHRDVQHSGLPIHTIRRACDARLERASDDMKHWRLNGVSLLR